MAYPKNTPDDMSELEDMQKPGDDPNSLANIVVFAERHQLLSNEAATYEGFLEGLNSEIKEIEEVKLPLIFDTLKIKEFKLQNGAIISIDPVFQGSIVVKDAAQKKKQLDWVAKNEGKPLIKTQVIFSFDKGDEQQKELALLLKTVNEIGFILNGDYVLKETIHAGTLGSFIKEKLAKGAEIPFDDLKWRIFNKAEIKVPGETAKRKKKKKTEDDE